MQVLSSRSRLASCRPVRSGPRAAGSPARQTTEKLGTVRFATSCSAGGAAGVRPRDGAPALVRVRAGDRELHRGREGGSRRCAIAEWGIALSRWGNPFAAGIKPPALLEAGRAAIEQGDGDRREDRPRARLHCRRRRSCSPISRQVDQRDAAARLSRCDGDARRDVRRRSRGLGLLRAGARRRRNDPTDKTYANLLKAGAILETARTDAARSSRLRALHHPRLRRAAARAAGASRPRAATRRSRRRRRTRCTCRRTRSRGSATGRIRSTPTSRRPAAAAARGLRPPKSCTRWTTRRTPTCSWRRTRARAAAWSTRCPRSRRDSSPTAPVRRPGLGRRLRAAAIPARYALERRAWSEAAALELRPSRFPHADAMTWFARGLGAAHTEICSAARAAVDALQQLEAQLAQGGRDLLGRAGRDPAARRPAWMAFEDGRNDDALTLHAKRGRSRGPDGEERGDARTDRARRASSWGTC